MTSAAMPSPALVSTAVLALAALARAQPARIPCNFFLGNFPAQFICDNLTPGGSGVDSTGFKADGYTPINSGCVEDPNEPGQHYCGYVGGM